MKKGEKLEFLIQQKYPYQSNRKFAELADVPPTTLQGIFTRGIENTSIQNAKKIARALDMSVDDLFDYVTTDTPDIVSIQDDKCSFYELKSGSNKVKESSMYKYYVDTVNQKTIREVHYYGAVSAGKPECIDGIFQAEKIRLPRLFMNKHMDRDDIFVMKVNGDSMNKILPANSLIVCLPIESLNEIKDNDIVVFMKDNETSVKRYKLAEENIIFSPESTNNKFYDIVVNKDNASDIKIIAKVISYHVVLD